MNWRSRCRLTILPRCHLCGKPAGGIPREADRHVFTDVGCLCLGVPLALWMQLKGDFSLPTILDNPLRNFLIGNALLEQGEPWPHGDHSHGVQGVLEFYGDLLGTSEPMAIARFLPAVVKGTVRDTGHAHAAAGKSSASAIERPSSHCAMSRRRSWRRRAA